MVNAMRFIAVIFLVLGLTAPAFAQTANTVIVNRLGSSGASIAIGTGSAVQILQSSTTRIQYCTVCTVPVNCTWTDPNSAGAPAVTPTSSVGYPLAANASYCEDARRFSYQAIGARMDCISTSGSGTCATREEQ